MLSAQRLHVGAIEIRPAFSRLALALLIGVGTAGSLAASWTIFSRELITHPGPPALGSSGTGPVANAAAHPLRGSAVGGAAMRKSVPAGESRDPTSGG